MAMIHHSSLGKSVHAQPEPPQQASSHSMLDWVLILLSVGLVVWVAAVVFLLQKFEIIL